MFTIVSRLRGDDGRAVPDVGTDLVLSTWRVSSRRGRDRTPHEKGLLWVVDGPRGDAFS
jgi:hypothetical protein